jgi:hypothetical protein
MRRHTQHDPQPFKGDQNQMPLRKLKIYLACPYSHPDPAVMAERTARATVAAGIIMDCGYIVFSPITHSHPIAETMPHVDNRDHEFWLEQDLSFISDWSDELWVLTLPGWEESFGIHQREIPLAKNVGQPVRQSPSPKKGTHIKCWGEDLRAWANNIKAGILLKQYRDTRFPDENQDAFEAGRKAIAAAIANAKCVPGGIVSRDKHPVGWEKTPYLFSPPDISHQQPPEPTPRETIDQLLGIRSFPSTLSGWFDESPATEPPEPRATEKTEPPPDQPDPPDPLDKISQCDFATIAGDRFMQGIIKGIFEYGDPGYYISKITDELDWRLSRLSEIGIVRHHTIKEGSYWPHYAQPGDTSWYLTIRGIRVYQALKIFQKIYPER